MNNPTTSSLLNYYQPKRNSSTSTIATSTIKEIKEISPKKPKLMDPIINLKQLNADNNSHRIISMFPEVFFTLAENLKGFGSFRLYYRPFGQF